LGVTAREAIGLPIDLLFSLKPLLENYRQVDDHTSAALAFETTLGRDTTYLVTVTLARDETGAVFGRVLVLKDISHLKRLDQFKSQMIQMASHDLRTPLGVASGYVELLREELPPSSKYDTLLNGLEGALARMQILVVELLDLERVEAGIDQIQVSVDVGQLTAEAAANFADEARSKQQTLVLTLAEALPPVMGDPLRLKQALGNLISNAVKYTPEGGQIEVRAFHDDQQVTLEVQDTGYGIPAADQSKVFQRFYRAKVPGTENIAGTGLGLSLVKAVIEQHAGSITLESEEGRGSTFRVQLPMAVGEKETSHG
jgi:two-component system phosphate regulon sensor histidine kinase PhoR